MSTDYQILTNAVEQIQSIDGLTCEIGTREGCGTKFILDTLIATNQHKVHISIDPFGDILYKHWENQVIRADYTNQTQSRMLENLYAYCKEYHIECLYVPLEDNEFFERYSNGVPIYDQEKTVVTQYALVFFDGPLIRSEFDFFKDKIPVGGYLVFDEYDHMSTLDPYIRQNHFNVFEQAGQMISYVKEG